MKFTCSIVINRPIQDVVAVFNDPQYLSFFQDGFLRKEFLSGIPGQEGSIAKMYYQYGKGEMELTETILIQELPDRFKAFYHHKHMDNTMECTFKDLMRGRTEYISEIEYTEFRGFMPKLLAKLFPGIFKKQVQKWLNNFKIYMEEKHPL